ncbi:MAG TPA: vWA domain-containing protein [Candidatus Limnocylindrales bacterium]
MAALQRKFLFEGFDLTHQGLTRKRFAAGAVTAALWLSVAGSSLAADSFTPAVVTTTLPAGGSTNIDKVLHLDALPGAADILFAVDTTGSMGPAITQAKSDATSIANAIATAIPGARFGLADFRDYANAGQYPAGTFGVAGDYPYLNRLPFTSSSALFQTAVNTLTLGNGGDGPESYNRVFYEAVNDPLLVYNPGAVRFVIVLGDNFGHDTTQSTTFSACPDTSVTDPGRDTLLGTTDDLTTVGSLNGLRAVNDTLLFVSYGNLACQSQLAAYTGGSAQSSGGAGTLATQIVAQIRAAAAHIDRVDLTVSAGCPLGVTFTPAPPYGPFTAPVDQSFQEHISAPTVPGPYSCTVTAVVDGTARATQTINATVTAAAPAHLALTPKTAVNVVDAQHCVTATVTDAFGNLVPNDVVNFGVTGSVTTTGTATTNASGQAQFCYTGPGLPGADLITATAVGGTSPSDTATKTWVIPANNAACKVNNGGRIAAANGDKATFGGNAKGKGPSGEEEFQDHGGAIDINVHSSSILAVTCTRDGTRASIFGKATINGAGAYDFRIDVQDLGEPGSSDTYRIRLSSGYDSGEQTLSGGNVQTH